MTSLEICADKALAALNCLPADLPVDIQWLESDCTPMEAQAAEWLLRDAAQNILFFADKAKRAAQILERIGGSDPEAVALLASGGAG